MQPEAQTIIEMSETLQSANFTKHQSDAVIESVALAMQTFAVTPKLLDDRLAKLRGDLREEWKQDLKGHKDDINGRLDDIQDLQRSLLRYFLRFTLAMFLGALGLIGALLFS